jgi:hypothetical protein
MLSFGKAVPEVAPSTEDLEVCAVCTEGFVVGDMVRTLPCSHVFHPGCVDRWISGFNPSCPKWYAGNGALTSV